MSLQLPERIVCLSSPGERSCRRGELAKGHCLSAVVPDEPTEEIREAKEGLEQLDHRTSGATGETGETAISFFFDCPLTMMYPMNDTELTWNPHLDDVFLNVAGEDQNVIDVNVN